MEELKPCPFCAGKGAIEHITSNGRRPDEYHVICVNCGAETDYQSVVEYAVALWNHREGDDKN